MDGLMGAQREAVMMDGLMGAQRGAVMMDGLMGMHVAWTHRGRRTLWPGGDACLRASAPASACVQ